MQQLKQLMQDDLPAQQAEFDAAVAAWERRGSPSRDEAPANGAAPDASPAGGDVSMTNGEDTPDVVAVEGESAVAPARRPAAHACAGGPPEKKWRFSDEQRHQIAICVVIEDALAQVQAEKM